MDLLFNRAVKLKLGKIMRANIKMKVSALFEEEAGIETRKSKIKSWNELAREQAKKSRCTHKICFAGFTNTRGLKTHVMKNHVKIVNPVTQVDVRRQLNQNKAWPCNVDECFISYLTKGKLDAHLRKEHHLVV